MAAERVLTGRMDTDEPIWAVKENVTVGWQKFYLCRGLDIN